MRVSVTGILRRLQLAVRGTAVQQYGCTECAAATAVFNVTGSWTAQPQQQLLLPCISSSQPHLQQWPLGCPVRGYAKGKGKGKKEAAAGADLPPPIHDEGEEEFSLDEFEMLMTQAVEHLRHELAGVRTGRANPGLLENITVNIAGSSLPLKACGAVTVRNPQLLAVSVYSPENVAAVVNAIQNSPLQLTPASEGSEVLVKLPHMTKETIDRMVKLVHMESEGAHQSVRRARQKAMDAVKKEFKDGSKDERKRMEKEVQKLHDAYSEEVERLKKQKDTELREHKD